MSALDFSDLKGQQNAVNELVKAIADGERGVLLVGPPSSGKTSFAQRIPSIMPALTDHERQWLQAEYDALYLRYSGRRTITARPFRAPHYTVGSAALIGRSSGTVSSAGEVQLARFGVLLLDEIDEFFREAIRSLRSALDRMAGSPFVVATARPCSCGWHGTARAQCLCSNVSIGMHASRVHVMMSSLGISTRIEIVPWSIGELESLPFCDSSEALRARIESMRAGRATEGSEP